MEGIRFEALDKSGLEPAVRKAWLKTDSLGTVLEFDAPFARHSARKIRIKLEVDTRPPAGSGFETHYLMFPVPAPLTTQDLVSAFATKTHALLCRAYAKGRDWYDFLWFVSRRVRPRLDVLACALEQQGPWAGQKIAVDAGWVVAQLMEVVRTLDWRQAVQDVQRFLPLREQEGLRLWNADFFTYHVDRMGAYMNKADELS